MVQGHVDGLGTVTSVVDDGFARRVEIAAPRELLRYVVHKGSIAVDGVSLTVAELDSESFTVSLIPETLQRTNLGTLVPGSTVNLEVDVLAKYVRAIGEGGGMTPVQAPFSTIEEAIEDIRQGNMVVVVDDENRENEGDLTIAAQFVTPETINFMRKEGGGLICLALTPERCDELGLDLMAAKNESAFETAFTVSIEARSGREHGDLGRRPCAHDPGRHRPQGQSSGAGPARAHLPAQGEGRRGARARRADRGGSRSCPAGRPDPGSRDLRDHERRRLDGARARPRAVLPRATG